MIQTPKLTKTKTIRNQRTTSRKLRKKLPKPRKKEKKPRLMLKKPKKKPRKPRKMPKKSRPKLRKRRVQQAVKVKTPKLQHLLLLRHLPLLQLQRQHSLRQNEISFVRYIYW